MRIAAIADLHCRDNEKHPVRELLKGVDREADVLVLAGDLTDNGRASEAEVLVDELKHLSVPIISVLGNHDHEGGEVDQIRQVLSEAGHCLLEASAFEVDGVGFVGTKGFAGGFGSLLVQPFGEEALKTFIRTSIDEAIQLENALAKLNCEKKIAILHYSPVRETLEGEPLELFPFLGSSRLANAVDRQGVRAIFHGHAHHGSLYGQTTGGVPVFNVSRFARLSHGETPYCVYEV